MMEMIYIERRKISKWKIWNFYCKMIDVWEAKVLFSFGEKTPPSKIVQTAKCREN